MIDWKDVAVYLAPMLALLAAGKAVRRIVFVPIEWLRNKLGNKAFDVIVEEAEKDVGIDKSTLPDLVNSDVKLEVDSNAAK